MCAYLTDVSGDYVLLSSKDSDPGLEFGISRSTAVSSEGYQLGQKMDFFLGGGGIHKEN
jgi:hypothetical protein